VPKQASLPLRHRRFTLTAKLSTSILEFADIPVHERLFKNHSKRTHLQKADHHVLLSLELTLSRALKFHCIHTVIPSEPSWLTNSLQVILKLTEFSKSSIPAALYLDHFHEVLTSFPESTLCFTDGLKIKNKGSSENSMNNVTFLHHHRNLASSFSAVLPTNNF